MVSLETERFRFNRLLLLAIGLWPYQESKLAKVQFLILFSILITFIVFQFTTFITSECTTNFIIKVLSSSFFFICLAIEYNSFWINADIVKLSLDQIQHTYNKLKNKNEIAILTSYGNIAQLYTAVLTIIAAWSIFVFLILQMWPFIIGVIMTMNNSGLYPRIYITTEYFVNQENCYYFTLLHLNAAMCIGVTAIIATGTMMLMYFKHICGMFNIASFRIEKAMMTSVLQNITQEKEILIYKGIIYAIDIHRKATEFSQFFIKNFEGSFFFLIAAGMVSLSSSFVEVASSNNIEELILPTLIIFTLYVYLVISNYTAQEVTDHNNRVFATVYNVQWYIAPLRIQKMLIFLLQRGNKAFNLNLGGLFVGSLESAAMLTSASISYFSVLYSTR
ncbi:uncharacterized protein LOC105198327 isoform X2 [Solenopsis invicta]|uniref:uncharacterized protein LOC105198327 isoform X2 n=1 Tax=Solenopsis invicta TaxID=13686 RepID=UPI00193DE40F|nr:uncharacterized protein LOC105198327 isoform X2 [Solenopsis invicta]